MSMRRRAGANVPPSSTSSSNANATDASVQPDRSSSTRRRTENCFPIVLVTSLVWLFILFVTLFLFSQFGTNASCPRPSLLQRSLCGIGHVFVSFCSDSDAPIFVHAGSAAQQSSTDRRSTTTKNNNENVPRIKFTDTYLEETCSNKESCSKDKSLYQIPDLGSLKNVNPTNWPGEMGEPYLPPSHLQDESKKRFAENMFDIVVSDQIALNRAMPDIRNDHCKAHSKFYHHLPNTSIIIVFHNEGNSTLLRTLVSIINRTPWRLIHEIILLDDASVDREYLRGPLEEFIQTLPVKTMMLRNERRLGLISSRVKAAKLATGETLMFLDSHVEVLNGWLLYLLEEIQKDRKTIVCPIIDVLTYDAFQLLHGATDIFGTFSWKMIFRWSKIQGQGIENQAAPIRTPTMAGGLYAIDRLYFEELGMYDEGIKIWGGENLEMSFKCWMCGGRIIIHPCSHVAHVFRKETPYKFLESESIFVTIFKNYKRVALVWLDEYKQLIYAVNPDIKRLNGGDVSDRLELRRKLNCSSFKHYVQMFQLKNFPLNHRFIGSVSTSKRRCLDSMTGPDISKGLNTAVQAQDCHKDGGNQIFLYTTANKIHFDEMCLEVGTTKIEGNRNIIFVMCEPDKTQQNWIYDQQNYQLKSEHFPGQCLTVQGDTNVVLAACDTSNVNQQWTFNQEVQLFD